MLFLTYFSQSIVLLCLVSGSFGERGPSANDSFVEMLQCDEAVSNDSRTSNEVCRAMCHSVNGGQQNLADFKNVCQIESFHYEEVSGKVYLNGSCFNQWIHGYSDEGLYGMDNQSTAQVGILLKKPLNSASECQEECQKSETCENWSWRVRANEGITGEVFEHGCLLKTAEMVNKALSISLEGMKDSWTSVGATDERYKWCNMGLGYRCADQGGYVCKNCGGLRCVFKSDHHIAGPKFCGKSEDECKPVTAATPTPNTTSTTTTTTTANPTTSTTTTTTTNPTTTTNTTTTTANTTTTTTIANATTTTSTITSSTSSTTAVNTTSTATTATATKKKCRCKNTTATTKPSEATERPCEEYENMMDVCRSEFAFNIFSLLDVSATNKSHRTFDTLKEELQLALESLNSQFDLKSGLGSFSDKSTGPFGEKDSKCYERHSGLTSDLSNMLTKLDGLKISEGGDSPNSQLDALLGVSLQLKSRWNCQKSGKRNGKDILNVVMMITDSDYHEAGDASEMRTNDGDKSIDCNGEDYPTVEQVEQALESQDITPLFVVTKRVRRIYEDLATDITSSSNEGVVVTVKKSFDNLEKAILKGIRNICESRLESRNEVDD